MRDEMDDNGCGEKDTRGKNRNASTLSAPTLVTHGFSKQHSAPWPQALDSSFTDESDSQSCLEHEQNEI